MLFYHFSYHLALYPIKSTTNICWTVAPVCRQGQRTVYSTGRHETVKIACEIEANPAETTYVWKFNATLGETIDIPASLIAIDRGRSIAHYTPMTENVSPLSCRKCKNRLKKETQINILHSHSYSVKNCFFLLF